MKNHRLVLLTGQFLENCHRDIHETKRKLVDVMGWEAASHAQWKTFLSESHYSFTLSLLEEQFEIVPAEDECANAFVTAALAFANMQPPAEIILGTDLLPSNPIFKRFNAEQRSRLSLIDPKTLAIESLEEGGNSRETLFRGDPNIGSVGSTQAFDLASSGWNHALVEYVIAHENAVLATEAFDVIDQQFSGLKSSFQSDRESLKKALSPELRWIEEGNEPILYHKSHPKFRPVPAQDAVKQLTFGQGDGSSSVVLPDSYQEISPPDVTFEELAKQANLLSEQAKRCCDLRALTISDQEFQLYYQEFVDKAKSLSLDSWMIQTDPCQYNSSDWKNLSQGYLFLSETASLMNRAVQSKPSRETLKKISSLYAQSVCQLKTLSTTLGISYTEDSVQSHAYKLGIQFAHDEKIFLPHLKDTDVVKKTNWVKLHQSVKDLADRYSLQFPLEQQREKLIGQIRDHLEKAIQGDHHSYENWQKVVDDVTLLCDETNLPPSSKILRNMLAESIDDIPEDVEMTPAFNRVVQNIRQFNETRHTADPSAEETEVPVLSPLVNQIRQKYGDSKVVWIGGKPVDHLMKRIETRLNVSVIWESFSHSDSMYRFQKVLNDPEVKLVLVYIPWCNRTLSEEMAQLAKRFHKDFVRLLKGTNPEQIAYSICDQIKNLTI